MRTWIQWMLVFVIALSSAAWGGVQDVVKSLEGLTPEQRHERLVEGAKKEGGVMLYSSSGRSTIKAVTKAFGKKYPFLKVQFLKKGGSSLFKVILLEQQGGQALADVFWAGGTTVGPLLKQTKILTRYASPERGAIPQAFKDNDGLWTGTRVSVPGFVYHKEKVPKDKVPKSYQDLLDPFWKGNLSADTNRGRATVALVEGMGWERADEFQRKLAAQDMRLQRGRTKRMQLVLAGESLGTFDVNADGVADKIKKGAPLDYALLEPMVLSVTSVAMPGNSPHPHAALLLYDYILSAEGQKVLAGARNVPARNDVATKDKELARRYAELRKSGKFVVQSPGNYDPKTEDRYDRMYIKNVVRK